MKNIRLLFAALLLPLFSVAQSHFMPGYIINLKGDTIKGSIDYQEWNENPQVIDFKNASEKIEQYTPLTSAGFGIIGQEYYRSQQVSISQDRTSISDLQLLPNESVINKVVYLRLLTTGPNITLYKYTDNIKSRFYYSTPIAQPQELIYKINYQSENSQVQYNNRFRNQLQNVVQQHGIGTTKSYNTISAAEYNEKPLVKIAQFINNNTNYSGPQSQFGSRYLIGLGVNLNNTVAGAKTVNNTSPEISAAIDFFENKITQSVFLRLVVSASGYKFTENWPEEPSGTQNVTQHGSSTLKRTYISINPQIVYNFYNTVNFKVFIGVGIIAHRAISNYFMTSYVYSNAPSITQTYDDQNLLSNFWVNFPTIKVGAAINKKIEVFAGYMPSKDIITQRINIYQAGLNYLFK